MNSDVNSDVRGWLTADQIGSLGIPGCPKSGKRVHDHAKREGWESRIVDSQGRTGNRREYMLPISIQDLIERRLQGALPATQQKAHVPKLQAPDPAANLAADPARSLYTYSVAPQPGGLEADPGTVSLVARCIVAAEKLLGDAYTREQQVTLAIDTWGALRRMFYGREAEHIAEIADADLELLTRFIYNTKRVLNPHAIKP